MTELILKHYWIMYVVCVAINTALCQASIKLDNRKSFNGWDIVGVLAISFPLFIGVLVMLITTIIFLFKKYRLF